MSNRILNFPIGQSPGSWRVTALAPFHNVPEHWRGIPADLEARFDLPACVGIVRQTRAKLARAVEATCARPWLYTKEECLLALDALSREKQYLDDLEGRLRAERAPVAAMRDEPGENLVSAAGAA